MFKIEVKEQEDIKQTSLIGPEPRKLVEVRQVVFTWSETYQIRKQQDSDDYLLDFSLLSDLV